MTKADKILSEAYKKLNIIDDSDLDKHNNLDQIIQLFQSINIKHKNKK